MVIVSMFCLILSAVLVTYAQGESESETGSYLKRDQWQSDRFNMYDESGRKTGEYLKADTWEPKKRYNFYDQSGNRTGVYLEQDQWEPDRYNFKTDP